MKTIQSMIWEAEIKQADWEQIADDPQALIDRGKTREEALCLANYFQGRRDALIEVRRHGRLGTVEQMAQLAIECGFDKPEPYCLSGESEINQLVFLGEYPCGIAVINFGCEVAARAKMIPQERGVV